MTPKRAEFDDYAANYDGGADNFLKKLLGDETAFMEWKVEWLEKRVLYTMSRQPLKILDFGCGTALALNLWHARRPGDHLAGTDVSAEMLKEASRRWSGNQLPDFRVLRPGELPWPEESFDLVLLSCILHHIPPAERAVILLESFRLLKPGGQICVFEHNPRNALVRYVVRNTKIDRNAILLRAEETATRLIAAGCVKVDISYVLFVPPFFKLFASLEPYLASVPFGGQYAVTGFRSGVHSAG